MDYNFPSIKHIDDVWPHVKDDGAFIRVHKNEYAGAASGSAYTVINYAYSDVETFPKVVDTATAMRRECRGLVFDGYTGEILSRPFHKFFNVNEKEETQEHLEGILDGVAYEKLDGSMVRPVKLASGIRWMTKMGITDTAMQAEVFVAKHPKYTKFASVCLANDITPIFEYIGPNNRIVVDYSEENLILLAMRHNHSGTYVNLEWHSVRGDLIKQGIPTVRIRGLKNLGEGEEGVVITKPNGHRVKLKTDWYVKLHKTKDLLSSERHLVRHILEDTLDDLIPLLPDKDKEYVQDYQHYFNEGFKEWRDNTNDKLARFRVQYNFCRKAFATRRDNPLTKIEQSLLFRGWDSGHIEYDEFKKCLLGFLNRDKDFETFKTERKHDLFLFIRGTEANSNCPYRATCER